MPQEYWKAEEVENIAEDLFQFHHDLAGAEVAFVFKEKATKSDGEPIIGKAFRVPAKYQPLMEMLPSGERGYDFIIVVGYDAWVELNNDNKRAWVDHLLEHCYGEEKDDGSIQWKLRRPQVQAFPVILSRHGTGWDAGVNRLSVMDLNRDEEAREPDIRTGTPTENGDFPVPGSSDSNGVSRST